MELVLSVENQKNCQNSCNSRLTGQWFVLLFASNCGWLDGCMEWRVQRFGVNMLSFWIKLMIV